MFKETKQKHKGFTLIEMMVSLSIFTVVMTVALGALLAVIDANKKSQATQSLMTELNFALDDIARNARVGTNYRCRNNTGINNIGRPRSCGDNNGGILFAFESSQGDPNSDLDQYVYIFEDNTIKKSTRGGRAGSYTNMISDNIQIDDMEFRVTGARGISSNDLQPRALILISGTAGTQDKTRTEFNIQTTITPRILDN